MSGKSAGAAHHGLQSLLLKEGEGEQLLAFCHSESLLCSLVQAALRAERGHAWGTHHSTIITLLRSGQDVIYSDSCSERPLQCRAPSAGLLMLPYPSIQPARGHRLTVMGNQMNVPGRGWNIDTACIDSPNLS